MTSTEYRVPTAEGDATDAASRPYSALRTLHSALPTGRWELRRGALTLDRPVVIPSAV
jgi:hypothetical protein